ncbi:MAG: radical SAM family heme chaperone HemW, partial [Firmicutes bacterium]|nr:radical SAM family heme chaperone HemW [Bacillota bacterium]
MKKTLGIYIHIPFCIRKCLYCDFVSGPASDEEKESYVEQLLTDIRAAADLYAPDYDVDTVYVGGGTPSVLSAAQLGRIIERVKSSFDGSYIEVSTEANPGTVDAAKLKDLKAAGFNRLSIGVQSFNDDVLRSLGRIHSACEAEKTALDALSCGFNTNLDLMLGVPRQSLEIWDADISKALELDVNHISFYSLQLEEGTPFYREYRYGNLSLPSWEENRAMYHSARKKLIAAGYHHYEISNAAKPGFECRHNLKYWTMQDYLGIGKAAHSYIGGKRLASWKDIEDKTVNRSWKESMHGLNYSKDPEIHSDDLQRLKDAKTDFIFTELRLIDGFREASYLKLFGVSFFEDIGTVYNKLIT